MKIPRAEYHRPQFERKDWLSLNGEWTYCFDFGKSGSHNGRKLEKSKGFSSKINVPFCPESKLSGVEYIDFIEQMWYHKIISIPKNWNNKNILLNFGAVDYSCELFINEKYVGCHFGGSSAFCFDITNYLDFNNENHLVLKVCDNIRNNTQPYGKQCFLYESQGCSYTRTTGIWQSVWLEAVNKSHLLDMQVITNAFNGQITFIPTFEKNETQQNLTIKIKDGEAIVAEATAVAINGCPLIITVPSAKLWSPQAPFLYNLEYCLKDASGNLLDQVFSYTGIRTVQVSGNQFLLNGEPLFFRFVLDQGFYPTGVWTAPSDNDLKRDIELSMSAGFNGARLHQKIFEPRFYYWADKLGYLVWSEFPSWFCNPNLPESIKNLHTEWTEIVKQFRNNPSNVAWTPWNESWDIFNELQHERESFDIYRMTKNMDPTRPINTSSGGIHFKTDLWTVHNYGNNEETLYHELNPVKGVWFAFPEKQKTQYDGQPYIVDECGGVTWFTEDRKYAHNTWGYGGYPKSEAEYLERIRGSISAIVRTKHCIGFCYTQLTDVEQEQNGVLYYDRTPKCDLKKLNDIFSMKRGE